MATVIDSLYDDVFEGIVTDYLNNDEPTVYNESNPYVAAKEVENFRNNENASTVRNKLNRVKNYLYRSDTFLEKLGNYVINPLIPKVEELITELNRTNDIVEGHTYDLTQLRKSQLTQKDIDNSLAKLKYSWPPQQNNEKFAAFISSLVQNNGVISVEAQYFDFAYLSRFNAELGDIISDIKLKLFLKADQLILNYENNVSNPGIRLTNENNVLLGDVFLDDIFSYVSFTDTNTIGVSKQIQTADATRKRNINYTFDILGQSIKRSHLSQEVLNIIDQSFQPELLTFDELLNDKLTIKYNDSDTGASVDLPITYNVGESAVNDTNGYKLNFGIHVGDNNYSTSQGLNSSIGFYSGIGKAQVVSTADHKGINFKIPLSLPYKWIEDYLKFGSAFLPGSDNTTGIPDMMALNLFFTDYFKYVNQGILSSKSITSIDLKMVLRLGQPHGLVPLDGNAMIPATYLPSYVDDIIEGYYNKSDNLFYEEPSYTTLIEGEGSKIYVDLTESKIYRYSGTRFVVISDTLALGYTSATAYPGDEGKNLSETVNDTDSGTKLLSYSQSTDIKINGKTLTISQLPDLPQANHYTPTTGSTILGEGGYKHLSAIKIDSKGHVIQVLEGKDSASSIYTNYTSNALSGTSGSIEKTTHKVPNILNVYAIDRWDYKCLLATKVDLTTGTIEWRSDVSLLDEDNVRIVIVGLK